MLNIQFRTDSEAFNEDPAREAARLLRLLADRIDKEGDPTFSIGAGPVMSDGKLIGSWSLDIDSPDDM